MLVEFINWLALTDEPVEAGSAVLGFDPKWHVYTEGESPLQATEAALTALLAEGYSAENIAVLSFHGQNTSVLASANGPARLAGQQVHRHAGFDSEGHAQWFDGPLLVDTVNRFKGQAADAVVITEVDFEALSDRDRRRLFVGLTRARLEAVLVTTERAAEVLRGRLGG